MKKFIGLLRKDDAEIIERYARTAKSVVEFGAGGSTHIIAQTIAPTSSFTSFETDAKWIALTKDRLARLKVAGRAKLLPHAQWPKLRTTLKPDLVFVDGLWALRRGFALEAWPQLRIGGHMLLHDTRRAKDIANVAAIVGTHFLEIESVLANAKHAGRTTNVTVIRKKAREPEVNWYKTEGKPRWAYGLDPAIPASFWR